MLKNKQIPYNFGLIGASGYIAPRHMKAIKETGNNLIAALDRNDSVGVIDSYFPNADFFLEPERFDRHLYKLRKSPHNKIHFVSICSPNYLHDAHIRLALRNQADAICEKPLVLNPWNIDSLKEIEKETEKRIYTILQLRLHPNIIRLKEEIANNDSNKIYDVDLTYITSRGNWYLRSWKGNMEKAGGISTNIGIHFFDMLSYIFGEVKSYQVNVHKEKYAAGILHLEKANVRWFLSIDGNHISEKISSKGHRTYRSLTIGEEEFDFSGGFTDLHTQSYQQIIDGTGWGIEDARNCIEMAYNIRNAKTIGLKEDYHPYLKEIK